MMAAEGGHNATVQTLIAAGANVNLVVRICSLTIHNDIRVGNYAKQYLS